MGSLILAFRIQSGDNATLAGYSRKVTPLACIQWRVRPLDGWMVVANPDHHYCTIVLLYYCMYYCMY